MAITQLRGDQLKDKSITKKQLADNLNLGLSQLEEGAELVKRNGSVAFTGDIDAGVHKIKNVADGTDAKDAINLSQLQSAIAGLPNAMEYKGQYDAAAGVLPSVIDIGDVYVVKGSGTFNGEPIQEGAELIAKVTKSIEVTADDFDVVNRQDQVVSVNGQKGIVSLAIEDIKNVTIKTDELNALAGIKGNAQEALDAKLDKTKIDVDGTLANAADDTVASSKAVKVYADALKTDLQGQINDAVTELEGQVNDAVTKLEVHVDEEVPVGTIDGVNKVFVIANIPKAGSVKVYLNGIRLRSGAENDYVLEDKNITFVDAPQVNDSLFVDYRK